QRTNLSAQSNFTHDLNVGGMYRGFLIHAKDVNGADLSGVIGNVKLRAGTTVFFDLPGEVILQTQRARYGLQSPSVDTVNDLVLAPFISNNSDRDAWVFIDLLSDGRLSEA